MDHSNYLPQEFAIYLVQKYVTLGKGQMAEAILLDPRISVNHFPDLWKLYIDLQCKKGNHIETLALISKLQKKCISDIFPSLYNAVIEKFILYNGKSKIKRLMEIVDVLISKKIPLNYQN